MPLIYFRLLLITIFDAVALSAMPRHRPLLRVAAFFSLYAEAADAMPPADADMPPTEMPLRHLRCRHSAAITPRDASAAPICHSHCFA